MIGFDETVFPELNFRSPTEFQDTLNRLQAFFAGHEVQLAEVFARARELEKAFDVIDPFIQEYTAMTCPYCAVVCCANRHGMPTFGDIVSFLAMRRRLPVYDLSISAGAACQFMGAMGCVLPRLVRPYRCTWYFCDPLLKQIEIGPASHYRTFIQYVENLSAARGRVLEAFHRIWSIDRDALCSQDDARRDHS
ncbi:MAG: hypothetical protein PHC35_01925 [Deltaproteobacteria bacterium]|jgi:hypothetical protein|nr:hypothetical protein [Deltaproteobacteria bacterium]